MTVQLPYDQKHPKGTAMRVKLLQAVTFVLLHQCCLRTTTPNVHAANNRAMATAARRTFFGATLEVVLTSLAAPGNYLRTYQDAQRAGRALQAGGLISCVVMAHDPQRRSY